LAKASIAPGAAALSAALSTSQTSPDLDGGVATVLESPDPEHPIINTTPIVPARHGICTGPSSGDRFAERPVLPVTKYDLEPTAMTTSSHCAEVQENPSCHSSAGSGDTP
jgi:hypothetical protein